MLWVYLVHSKGEWLDTLKRLVREYGPTTNAKSANKLKYLNSDFCKELQSLDSTEYFKNVDILLYSSIHISMPKTQPSVSSGSN